MTENGTTYAEKMNDIMSNAIREWWNGLTKEELLCYIAEQPTLTADSIRSMMANSKAVLAFDTQFSTQERSAATDFHASNA